VRPMCKVLRVHPSGFYKWLKEPESPRTIENKEITEMIRFFWKESGQVYGSPNIYEDFRDAGYKYSLNRITRLMKVGGIKGAHRRKKHYVPWTPGDVYQTNLLNREFSVSSPNQAWCTDITYIKTYEGFLYLAVVIDLFNRGVVGWAMKNHQRTSLVMDALFMAVKRRKPRNQVLIHSDQGCQFTSKKWEDFCKYHSLDPSMSRRGNCWDNSVVESFFSNLKRVESYHKSAV
jgi:putative transposase